MRGQLFLPLLAAALIAAGCAEQDVPPMTAPEMGLFADGEDCDLGFNGANAYDAIAALRAEVDELESEGSLNPGQAKALRSHLDNAVRLLKTARNCEPIQAQLRAFREQVGNYVEDGILTEEEAARLLGGGEEVGGAAEPLVEPTISAGHSHSCGLTASGTAYCWGANQYGQLGEGTTEDRSAPTAVSGDFAFTAINVMGDHHTCAITEEGVAYCWGRNNVGQLGDGTQVDRHEPTAVSGEHAFATIAAGGMDWDPHTCGLSTDGVALCWGENRFGQLGDGTITPRLVPTPVSGEHTFVSLTMGSWHTCGLADDGAAYCWGRNFYGEIGDATTTARRTPTAVNGGHTFVDLSAGESHTCGVRDDGAAYCWGRNSSAQLGHGAWSVRYWEPRAVSGEHAFASITAGSMHTCAKRVDDAPLCWGANANGQLGDGTTEERAVPTALAGSPSFALLAGGHSHTCGVAADGAAFCWGGNGRGQVGDGTTEARTEAVAVNGWSTLP